MKKNNKPRTITVVTVSQTIFLTIKFFLQNRLMSYAGACSFSFIFSFIPVFMMIVMVLVRILHASPDMLTSIFSTFPEIEKYFSYNSIVSQMQNVKKFSLFEVFVGISIFWMARRFFASIFDAMQNIFHTRIKRKALINQILTFGVEAGIVIVVAAVIFAYVSVKAVLQMDFFRNLFSENPSLSFIVEGVFIKFFISNFSNILIFVILAVLYWSVPGSKPSKRLCFTSAFLCTFSFWLVRTIMHLFLNVNKYNLIYGVLGQIIITLMDVFFFFTIFLFFAQFIFVVQFFDELLFGELYLLPKKGKIGRFENIKRSLFIRADYLIAKEDVVHFKKGDLIFKIGTKTDCAYYVVKGTVRLTLADNSFVFSERGDFFGEVGCILLKPRSATATAETDVQMVKIDAETFRFLVHQNPDAARRTLGQFSDYFKEDWHET